MKCYLLHTHIFISYFVNKYFYLLYTFDLTYLPAYLINYVCRICKMHSIVSHSAQARKPCHSSKIRKRTDWVTISHFYLHVKTGYYWWLDSWSVTVTKYQVILTSKAYTIYFFGHCYLTSTFSMTLQTNLLQNELPRYGPSHSIYKWHDTLNLGS